MPTHLNKFGQSVALVLALGMAVPAVAQSPSTSELQALRFYLDQGNDRAVGAELRRLQAEFPEWTPPADLSQLLDTSGPTSIDQIYRLIEAGDFDAARALIGETDRSFPEWSPPSDMMDLLNLAEGQVDFTASVAAGQLGAAIGLVRSVPALLSCERVNNAWELAELYLSQGDTAQAIGVYRSVLRSCSDRAIVIPTLEKADAVSSLEELAALSDLAREQHGDLAALIRQTEDRLLAGRQEPARWGSTDQVIVIDGGPPVPESAQQAPPARPAPRPAAPQTPPPPAAAPSSATAQPAAPAAGQNAIERAAQRGAWAECLALSANSSNVNIIFQRGWCAYNAERTMEAVAAFRDVAQRSGTASVRRDAAYGWMLSLLKMNMTEQAAQLAAGVDLTRTQRIEVEGQILDQRGVRAYENREYARAIAFFEAHEQLTGHMRRDLALLRGYALLNLGNRAGARDIFMTLHRQLSTRETRNALAALQ